MGHMNAVGTTPHTATVQVNYVSNRITDRGAKMDASITGPDLLLDADLAKESAQLLALQVRQQSGVQAFSPAKEAPQALLSLFK